MHNSNPSCPSLCPASFLVPTNPSKLSRLLAHEYVLVECVSNTYSYARARTYTHIHTHTCTAGSRIHARARKCATPSLLSRLPPIPCEICVRRSGCRLARRGNPLRSRQSTPFTSSERRDANEALLSGLCVTSVTATRVAIVHGRACTRTHARRPRAGQLSRQGAPSMFPLVTAKGTSPRARARSRARAHARTYLPPAHHTHTHSSTRARARKIRPPVVLATPHVASRTGRRCAHVPRSSSTVIAATVSEPSSRNLRTGLPPSTTTTNMAYDRPPPARSLLRLPRERQMAPRAPFRSPFFAPLGDRPFPVVSVSHRQIGANSRLL